MTQLVAAARAYIGTPFLHQGRNPAAGIDCVGLLVLAARDIGWAHIAAHDTTTYSRDPHHGLLEAHMDRALGAPIAIRPQITDLRAGDVVAMRYDGGTRHVGIVAEQHYEGVPLPSLIHTDSRLGRVTEHRIDARWLRRIVRLYRPEVPDVR